MVIHSEGKIDYINELGTKLIGSENYKNLIGKKIVELIDPQYVEIVTQRIQESITTNQQVQK